MHRIIFLFFILAVPFCSSAKWKPVTNQSSRIPYLFDQWNVIGTGIKRAPTGYYGKTCLKRVSTETGGGIFTVEFHRIDKNFITSDIRLKEFIDDSLKRSRGFNLSGKDILPFLINIKIEGRHSSIVEETAEFLPLIKKIIAGGDMTDFFNACGTEFIHTVRFDSHLNLFAAYYVSSDDEKAGVEKALQKRIGKDSGDIMQLKIFEDLGFSGETYFSMQAGTDNIFTPAEFPHLRNNGESISDFLNRSVHSLMNSDKGIVRSYETMPWKMLGPLKNISRDSNFIRLSESSDESIYNSLEAIGESVSRLNLRYLQARRTFDSLSDEKQKIFAYECLSGIIEGRKNINSGQYNACYKKFRETKPLILEEIPECSLILKGIRELDANEYCRYLPDFNGPGDRLLDRRTYIPLELADKDAVDNRLMALKARPYRFTDKHQFEKIPASVPLGQTMDWSGRLYSMDCIKEGTLLPVEMADKKDWNITGDYYPQSYREWPLWKRIIFFWKKAPPKRALFRSSFEITGFSKRLPADFELTDKARELASSDLVKFFEKYGTHYVSNIEHRRGYAGYYSFGSEDDADIRVIPYGISGKAGVTPVKVPGTEGIDVGIPGQKGAGCFLSSLIPFKFTSPAQADLMKPKSVKEFFSNKEKITALFKDDSEPVPLRLYLEPWIEYLKIRKIVKGGNIDIFKLKIISGKTFGTYRDKQGALYTGELKDGIADGEGFMEYSDGSNYSGEYKKGRRHGYGKIIWANGDRFTGSWDSDERSGIGNYYWLNGDIYSGNFTKDMKNGNGDYKWKNGDYYRGEWKSNLMDGAGMFIWSNGTRYKGLFKDNLPSGKGKYSNLEDK